MNLLDAGQAALVRRMKASRGRSLTYSRGGTQAAVTGWVGLSGFPATLGEHGARQEWGDRDYFFAVADLSTFGEPQEGDRVTETLNGTATVFEVILPAGGGEQAWRYSDQNRTVYRLHTKKVA